MNTFLGNLDENSGVLELAENLTVEQFKNLKIKAFKIPQDLRVDAKNLKNCDSSGISAILWLIKEAKNQQRQVALINLPFTALRLIKLYGLEELEPFNSQ